MHSFYGNGIVICCTMGGVRIVAFLRPALRLLWNRDDEPNRDTWHRPDSKLQGKGAVFLAKGERDCIPLVYKPNLSVKDVLIEAAKKAKISPIALDFFTLVAEDGKYLLNPQHLITEPECKQKYFFKLCFKACCASELRDIDPEAFNYYFHQCRKDFLDGVIGEFTDSEDSFKKYFTLIILEVIWRARENNVSAVKVIQNPKTYGVHKLYQRSFLGDYRDKEVKAALKQKVHLFLELKDDKFKFEYLHALESSPDFFIHRITVQKHYHWSTGPTSSVIEWEILISKEFGIKKRRIDRDNDCPEDVLKEFKDVKSIEVDPNNRYIIIIQRADARPEVLVTKSQEDAQCLITLIEGYYRLMVNQYVMLTRTPATNSTKPKYHGPIERKRAEALLQAKGIEDGLYLIRKKRSDHNVMVLSLCHTGKVKHYNIVKNKDGSFVMGSGKVFKDLPSLMEYYTQKEDRKLPVNLKTILPPPIEGFSALLDHQPITPTAERPIKVDDFQNIQKIPECSLDLQATLGMGEFGSVRKAALIDDESHESCEVVFREIDKGPKAFQEKFYKMTERLMVLKNSNIAQLVGVCVTRKAFKLVSEYVPDGSLDTYIKKMSQQNKGLTRGKVVLFGAQIAEGMMYLHSKDCVHGRLCAHNVLVGQNAETVKLTDVGLWKLRMEGSKFFHEDPNKYGFNWYAPESLQSGVFTRESDVWAFGLTLYEMFAMEKPFGALTKDQIMSKYLRAEYLDPSSPNCPQQVEEVIKKCCNPLQEERVKFREILRELRALCFKMGEDLNKLIICLGGDVADRDSGADIVLKAVSGAEADDYSIVAGGAADAPEEQTQAGESVSQSGPAGTSHGANGSWVNPASAVELLEKSVKKSIPRANSFPGARNRHSYPASGGEPVVSDDSRCHALSKPSVCRAPSWPAATKLPCEHEWKLTDSNGVQEIERKDASSGSSPDSNGYITLLDSRQVHSRDIAHETPVTPANENERYVDVDVLWNSHNLAPNGTCHGPASLSPASPGVPLVHQRVLSNSCDIVQTCHVHSDVKEYNDSLIKTSEDVDVEEEGSSSTLSEESFTSEDNGVSLASDKDQGYQNIDDGTCANTGVKIGDTIISGFDIGQFLTPNGEDPEYGSLSSADGQTTYSNSLVREDNSSDALASLASLSMQLPIAVDVEQFLIETKTTKEKGNDSQKLENASKSPSLQSITDSFRMQPGSSLFGSMSAEEHLSMLWKNHNERKEYASAVANSTGETVFMDVAGQNSESTSVPTFSDNQMSNMSNQGSSSPVVHCLQQQQYTHDSQCRQAVVQERCSAHFDNIPRNISKSEDVNELIYRFQKISTSSTKSLSLQCHESNLADKFNANLGQKAEQQSQVAGSPTFSLEGWGISADFSKPMLSKPVKLPESALRKHETSDYLYNGFSKSKHVRQEDSVASASKRDSNETSMHSLEEKSLFSGLDLSAWGIDEPKKMPSWPANVQRTRETATISDQVQMYRRSWQNSSTKNAKVLTPECPKKCNQVVQTRATSSLCEEKPTSQRSTLSSSYVEVPQNPLSEQTKQLESRLKQHYTESLSSSAESLRHSAILPIVLPENPDPLPFGVSETCADSFMSSSSSHFIPTSHSERSLASSFPTFQSESWLASLGGSSLGSKPVETLPYLVNKVDGKKQEANVAEIPYSTTYVDNPAVGTSNRTVTVDIPTATARDSTESLLPTLSQDVLVSSVTKKESPPSDFIEMTQLSRQYRDSGSGDPSQTHFFKEGRVSNNSKVTSKPTRSVLATNIETARGEKANISSTSNVLRWLEPDGHASKTVFHKNTVDEPLCNWADIPSNASCSKPDGVLPETNPDLCSPSHRPLPILPASTEPLIREPTVTSAPGAENVAGVPGETIQEDSSVTGGYKEPPVRSLSETTIGAIVGNVEPQQRRKTVSEMSLDKSKIPENLKVSYDDLQMGKKIGEGNFGEVRRATLLRRLGQVSLWKEDVAVKLLKNTAKKRDKEDFVKEAENMLHLSKVRNQYIITLRGVCFDPNTNMLLITELAPRGSLLQYIKNEDNEKLLGIPRLLDFALQIAKGMAYLEEQPLVHRDLAARNILVVREDMVKISDFGLSRMMDYYKVSEGKWPRKWYAPESLEFGRFKPKSDVWSYGVTLWEIFTHGLPPYPAVGAAQILDFIKEGGRLPPPKECPQIIYNVMKECWHYEAIARPTFFLLSDEILPNFQKNEYPVSN